ALPPPAPRAPGRPPPRPPPSRGLGGPAHGGSAGPPLPLARHPRALRGLLVDPEQEPALHASHPARGRARGRLRSSRAAFRVATRRWRGRAGRGRPPDLDDAPGPAAPAPPSPHHS